MAVYLTETFEAGPPLHAESVTPGWGEFDNPPNWSTTYPISAAYEADVVAGGKSGYGLGPSTAYDHNWIVIFQVFPFSAGGPGQLTPLADAGKGRVQFDFKPNAALFGQDGGYGLPLFNLGGGYWDATYDFGLALDNGLLGGGTTSPFRFKLYGALGLATPESRPQDYYPVFTPMFQSEEIPYASLVDGEFHTIEVTWQCGTVSFWDYPRGSTPPTNTFRATVAADGWVKVKVDGVAVIDQAGIRLMVNYEGSCNDATGDYYSWSSPEAAAAVNRFTSVQLGDDDDLPGIYDNLIVGTPGEEWVDIPDFVEVELSDTWFRSGGATVRATAWTGAPEATVQLRLQNVTDDVTAGTSDEVSETTPTAVDFPVTLSTGEKYYRLQATGTPGADLFVHDAQLVPTV